MAMAATAALLVLLLVAPTAYGAQHVVGDSQGWNTNVNYTTWATGKTFAVGDTLLFNYGPSHSVEEVTQAFYTNCKGSIIKAYLFSATTTISLDSTGLKYYSCPTAGHCQQGMKLAITVVAAAPGSPSSSPSPPGTTTPPPPPPPPSSGAAGKSYGVLMSSILMVAVVALMG